MSKAINEMNEQEKEAAELKEIGEAADLFLTGVLTFDGYQNQLGLISEKYKSGDGNFTDENGNIRDTPATREAARRIYGM